MFLTQKEKCLSLGSKQSIKFTNDLSFHNLYPSFKSYSSFYAYTWDLHEIR